MSPVSVDQLASAARNCSVLSAARTLAEWVGLGRPITSRGVLKPAAVVEVCDLLGIELATRRPRSALDVDQLMMVWATASVAGFIEMDHAQVTAGPALPAWTDGTAAAVLDIWTRCVLESLGLDGMDDESQLDLLAVLATLYEHDGVASLAELDDGIADVIGGGIPDDYPPGPLDDVFGPLDEFDDPADADADVDDLVAALGAFGIVAAREDSAELTPLGRWFTDFLFRESAPDTDVDAATLVGAVSSVPPKIAVLLARPWLATRAPAAAAGELLAVGAAGSGSERLTALALARECGPESAPAWRAWAAKDGFGAYARAWLAEQEGAEPAPKDMAWITTDMLNTVLDAAPAGLPRELLSDLLAAHTGDDLAVPNGRPAGAVRRPGGAGGRYRIKVQLLDVTEPPVWRRLEVPADLSLDRLHEVIQAAMGWYNCHLHTFSDGENEYGAPDPELDHHDERTVLLSGLLTGVGDTLRYTYDYGDDWEHDIVLEQVLPTDAGTTGAVCTAGTGACPPEDCGGPWGYRDLKATLADPDSDQHHVMLEWLDLPSGKDFDPSAFATEVVNRRLSRT